MLELLRRRLNRMINRDIGLETVAAIVLVVVIGGSLLVSALPETPPTYDASKRSYEIEFDGRPCIVVVNAGVWCSPDKKYSRLPSELFAH